MQGVFAVLFSFSIVSSAADALVLRGGTVWTSPTEKPAHKASVLMENGRIAAVGNVKTPRGAQVIDCSGLTILAGFWNSHVHFFQRKWESPEKLPIAELQQQVEEMITRYGFTSVSTLARRGQVHASFVIATSNHEVTTADQAATAAQAILSAGADSIKIHLQRPIPEPAVRTAVDVAHRAGKPVFLHPSRTSDVVDAANAGVDILAHTTPFSDWDASVIPRLLEKKVDHSHRECLALRTAP
jgi:imidazolonepropionase-like amidohydrolase